MAPIRRISLGITALFYVLCLFPVPSNTSSGFLNNSYHLIAHHFGIQKIPNITLPKDTSNKCVESLFTVVKDPINLMRLYLDASGKPPSGFFAGNMIAWLGSYSECTKMIAGAHYCLTNIKTGLKFSNDAPPLSFAWGICAPQQCSEQDITKMLEKFFSVVRQTAGVDIKLTNSGVNGVRVPGGPVHCNKKTEYTVGVIISLALCCLILFLCLVGTIVDIILSFTMPHPSPVSKNDGFMPIRNGSIATDHDEAGHGPGPFENDSLDSFDTTPHTTGETQSNEPSSEVNFIGRSTEPSCQQRSFKPSAVIRFFSCFSLIQNTNRIMDTQVPRGAITSINGMRVLSMWWVILGHTHLYYSYTCTGNLFTIPAVKQRFTFEAIENATFSVDSFFFLSGLLVAYLSLRHMEKTKGQLSLFKYYFHRFWRLTPTYMFVLLFFDKLMGFLGEGPYWFFFQSNPQCDKYWWTNLLYINNFYPTTFNDQCMGWGWYLANDMQFYIIAPAILFMAYRFRLRGLLGIVGLLMTASFISTAVIYYRYDIVAPERKARGADPQSLVYEKPYCRIAPYLVGMMLGYLLLQTKDWNTSRLRTYLFNVSGWSVAIFLSLSTLYGPYKTVRKNNPHPFTRAENIMYGTFARCAWSLALAWVIFACHRGLGGLVDKILSARFWIPLSRLTYCAYLVHLIALITLIGSHETANTPPFRMSWIRPCFILKDCFYCSYLLRLSYLLAWS